MFAFLWAAAVMFHLASRPAEVFGRWGPLVWVPALWVMFRPGSLRAFVALLVGQSAQVWLHGFARVSNHWFFVTFVNVTILTALAGLVLARRWRGSTDDLQSSLFQAFGPVVRLELLLMYGFSTLHKLNSDFFNPALSCGTSHYGQIAAHLPVLPTGDWLAWPLILGTVAVEGGIPLLLLFGRTRLYGLLLGWAFHFVLGAGAPFLFFNFSAMVYAVYFLFAPFDFWTALTPDRFRSAVGQRAVRFVRGAVLRRTLQGAVLTLGVFMAAAYLLDKGIHTGPQRALLYSVGRWSFVAYALGLIAVFLAVTRTSAVFAATRGLTSLLPRPAFMALFPVLLLFNGLNPYLGLKTQSAFAMYSNLRTEGGESNHFLLPVAMQIAPHQRDAVQVVASSDLALSRVAKGGLHITYFELRRMTSSAARERPDASVTFVRNGETRTVPRIADDSELVRGPSRLLGKLLYFRPFDPPGVSTPCRH